MVGDPYTFSTFAIFPILIGRDVFSLLRTVLGFIESIDTVAFVSISFPLIYAFPGDT